MLRLEFRAVSRVPAPLRRSQMKAAMASEDVMRLKCQPAGGDRPSQQVTQRCAGRPGAVRNMAAPDTRDPPSHRGRIVSGAALRGSLFRLGNQGITTVGMLR